MAPSQQTADDLLAAGADPARVEVVFEGCDHLPPPDRGRAAALLGVLGVKDHYLLTVSTLEPRKNLARLVAAYEVARPKLPGPWPLVVVGPRTPGTGMQLPNGVILAGQVEDAVLAGLYAEARLVASVPLGEGFGLAAVEPMGLGAPVVASPQPSTGGAAHEVDPLDVGSIAEALVQVAKDEALRADLVAAGRARTSELMTWAGTAARHAELWASVVKDPAMATLDAETEAYLKVAPSNVGGPSEEAEYRDRAIEALALFDVASCAKALDGLQERARQTAAALRDELPDLELARSPLGPRILAIWRLLDARSPLRLRSEVTTPAQSDQGVATDDEPEPLSGAPVAPRHEPAGEPHARRPEVLGSNLEGSMRDLMIQLFDLDDPANSGWTLRRQKHGEQYGFDLSFRAPARGNRALCLVECKNYSKAVTFEDVASKILQAKANWPEELIDHWILVSPHVEPDNRLHRAIEQWNADREFPFSIQVWSPDSGVRELFLLSAAAHQTVYGNTVPDIDVVTLAAVRRDFRQRLAPYLRVPRPFLRAAKEPRRFIHLSENPDDWPQLLGTHLPREGLTEARLPLARPLLPTVLDWIAGSPGDANRSLLLLGDFGEGKSFFTFEVCVAQVGRFMEDPAEAPFPLRMVLKDYRHIRTPAHFVESQLAQLGASTSEYYELRHSANVVVILDGVDEMSIRQDPKAVSENLEKLRDLLDHLSGVPVLMTSRPHFFESSTDRDRFYDRLRRPVVYRIGQPNRKQTLAHLDEFAVKTGNVAKLRRLQRLYDPVGLAGKMLFLQMVKMTLPDLPEDNFSEVILYNTYVDQALRRKIDLIEDPGARLTHAQQIDALRALLEDIAVAVHQSGTADLRAFRHAGGLAQALWQLADESISWEDDAVETDAAARVGMRSLLRKVSGPEDGEEWQVDFFHRSLKEFFVGRAIMRVLRADDNLASARALLSTLVLQPEISRFVRQLCDPSEADRVHSRLTALARSAVRALGESPLGGNTLTLLYRCGGRLSDQSWSDLCLDGAWLVGADLSHSDLRRSTLRWAILDNAILTEADLRDADFTGVRLEETSIVTDLAIDGSGRPVVLYDDCSIRRWELDGHHASDVVVENCGTGGRIELLDDAVLVVRSQNEASIWVQSQRGKDWLRVARFPAIPQLARLAPIGKLHLAALFTDGDGSHAVVVTALETAEQLRAVPVTAPVLASCASALAFVGPLGTLDVYDALTGTRRGSTGVADVISASLREDEEGTHVAITTTSASLHVLRLGPSGDVYLHAVTEELLEAEATHIAWTASGLASLGSGRELVLLREDENAIIVQARLSRRLRCHGAKVRGLRGEPERALLVAAGAEL